MDNTFPKVGIFWRVPHEGALVLVTDSVLLEEAEVYGDCLTHPRGHYEVWETWRRLGSRELKRLGLPMAILRHEYEHFPRGRIVSNSSGEKFIIYADRHLQSSEWVDRIIQDFNLRNVSYTLQSDNHYRTIQK